MEDKLITKYNKPDNFILLSDYPKPHTTHDENMSAVGFVSKKTIESMRKQETSSHAIILANKTDSSSTLYEEHGALIARLFKRNDPVSFIKLFLFLLKFTSVKKVVIEFEFGTYGTIMSALMPIVLLVFKLLGKKVVFVLHQVETNLVNLTAHLGLSPQSAELLALQIIINFFYKTVGLLSYKVIVLEEELKQRLAKHVKIGKIEVIPLGIDSNTNQHTSHALKNKLQITNDDFVIVLFGYIAWYKGTDLLIEIINKLPRIHNKNIKLLIAGGESYVQKGTFHYDLYFKGVAQLIKKSSKVIHTGFIKDEEIGQYLALADIFVLPYRRFISTSGPLSLALSYNKPIFFSENLLSYTKSLDFRKALEEANLSASDLFIPITTRGLKNAIITSMTNVEFQQKMQHFISLLREKRSWKTTVANYLSILDRIETYQKAKGFLFGNTIKLIPIFERR